MPGHTGTVSLMCFKMYSLLKTTDSPYAAEVMFKCSKNTIKCGTWQEPPWRWTSAASVT